MGAAAETHLYQTSPPPINTRECGAEELVCTVEAVIRCSHSVDTDMLQSCLHTRGNNATLNIITLLVSLMFSLLKEAEIHAEQREFELNRRRQMGLSTSHHSLDNIEFDNKEDDQHDQRLLSQFGIWFLVCNHRLLRSLSMSTSWEIRMCAEHGPVITNLLDPLLPD